MAIIPIRRTLGDVLRELAVLEPTYVQAIETTARAELRRLKRRRAKAALLRMMPAKTG